MGILADVSGKGISAALLSSMVLGAISTEFRAGVRPEELLARVNRLICERSLDFQYVTLFLFLLNPLGAGQFISAGHNVAYVVRTAGKIEKLRPESFAVGMFESSTWKSRSLHLEEGDILFVYSDGLTDAQNPQEQMFGEARLLDVIREAAPGGAAMLEAKVLTALAEFTCGRPQTDDITFLAIQRLTESRETVSSN
jgi:sigma-B regulation protein RsbU (phosphoserine phosphatase)